MSDVAEANVIHDFIAKAIADHPVVLFMKGVPDSPQCGFSAICVQIPRPPRRRFRRRQRAAERRPASGHQELLGLAPTIPQLYVKGEFVGGADIVREMFQSGELKPLLIDKGVLAA